jgi:hypothetical protein
MDTAEKTPKDADSESDESVCVEVIELSDDDDDDDDDEMQTTLKVRWLVRQ